MKMFKEKEMDKQTCAAGVAETGADDQFAHRNSLQQADQ